LDFKSGIHSKFKYAKMEAALKMSIELDKAGMLRETIFLEKIT
jgi:hypothetical protein